jgi:hypothetical protein
METVPKEMQKESPDLSFFTLDFGNGSMEVDMIKKIGLFFLVVASVLSCMSPVVDKQGRASQSKGSLEIVISDASRTILPSYAAKVVSYQVVLKSGVTTTANESFLVGESMLLSDIPVGSYTLESLR